jgi:hypothetical protein
MIDVSALATDLGFEPVEITIRTFGASTSSDRYGEETSTPSDDERTVVVHVSGRAELQRLGLDFKRETISVYDNVEIPGGGATKPAEILYQSRWYQVVRVGDYGRIGGIYLVHAALIDRDQDSTP